MRIEPKQAFYNEDTGAVQPWKDIEVTDAVGNKLVAEGLVREIEGGDGGGGPQTVLVYFPNSTIGHQVVGDFDAALADVKVGKPILAYSVNYNESETGFDARGYEPLGVSYDSTSPDRIDLIITAGAGFYWTASGVEYFD